MTQAFIWAIEWVLVPFIELPTEKERAFRDFSFICVVFMKHPHGRTWVWSSGGRKDLEMRIWGSLCTHTRRMDRTTHRE